MEKLDLNALGVEEITKKEMVKTDGGDLESLIAGYLFGKAVDAWGSLCSSMEDWMEANPDQVAYYRALHQ